MKPIMRVTVLPVGFVLCAFAQSPATPPDLAVPAVQTKRAPGGQSPPQSQTQVPPPLQKYDMGQQLKILQDPTAIDRPKSNDSTGTPVTPGLSAEPDGKAPKGFQPRTDVPLNPTAMEAVRVSETWRTGQNAPVPGADGRVLYAYGAGLPIIVCAPLRVCMIELQAGERITGEPQIGDSVRWLVSPAMYGRGEETTQVIVLKPQGPDSTRISSSQRTGGHITFGWCRSRKNMLPAPRLATRRRRTVRSGSGTYKSSAPKPRRVSAKRHLRPQ
jgi:type IV secretion system protein TrbG